MQQNSNRESVSGATTRRSLQQNLDTLRECKDTWEQAKKLLEASSMPKNNPVPQENVKQPINRDELSTKTRLTALKNRVQKRANEWENISSKISESLALNRDG